MGLRPGSGVGPFSPLTHCIPSSPLPGTPTPLLNCTAPLSHHLSNESLPPVYRLASLSDALKKKSPLYPYIDSNYDHISGLPFQQQNWATVVSITALIGLQAPSHRVFIPTRLQADLASCQTQRSILSLPLRSIPGIPGGPALYSCTDLSPALLAVPMQTPLLRSLTCATNLSV